MTDILMAPASDWSTHSHDIHDLSSNKSMSDIDSIPSSPSSYSASPMRSNQHSPYQQNQRYLHGGKKLFDHGIQKARYGYEQQPYPHPSTTYPYNDNDINDPSRLIHDRMISNLSKLLAVAQQGVDTISEDESGVILQDLGVDVPPPSTQKKRFSLQSQNITTPSIPTYTTTPTSDVMSLVTPTSQHSMTPPFQHINISQQQQTFSPLPSTNTISPTPSQRSLSSHTSSTTQNTSLHHFQSNLEYLQQQLQQHQQQCELLQREKEVLNQTLVQFQSSITHTQKELSRQLQYVTAELTAKDIALTQITQERDDERVSHMEKMEEAKIKMEEMKVQEESVRGERDRIFNELTSLQSHHTHMSQQHRQHHAYLKQQLQTLTKQVEQLTHEKQVLKDVIRDATEGMQRELERAVQELKNKELLLDTLTSTVASDSTRTSAEMYEIRSQYQRVQQQCQELQVEKEQLSHSLSDYHTREQSMQAERSALTTQIQDMTQELITLRQQHSDEQNHSQELKQQLTAWKEQTNNVTSITTEHTEMVKTLQEENELLRRQKIEIQQAYTATESSLLSRIASLMEKLALNDKEYTLLIQHQTQQIDDLTKRGEYLTNQLRMKEDEMLKIQSIHEQQMTSLHHRLGGIEDQLETRTHELTIANNHISNLQHKIEYLLRRSYTKGQTLEIVFCLQLVLLVSYLALDWSNGLVMGTQPTFS